MSKLCLVDSRVVEAKVFIDSVQPDVSVILIDYENDTFHSLLSRIQLPVSSVAYVAHGTFAPTYSFFSGSSFDMNTESDWQPFVEFLQVLRPTYFDFLGCSMASDLKWQQVFGWFHKTGVVIRASLDVTGNLAQGGNWILEDGSVDAKALYFTNLDSFDGLLVLYNFDTVSIKNITNVINVTNVTQAYAEAARDWYIYNTSSYSNILRYTNSPSPAFSPTYTFTGRCIIFNSYYSPNGSVAYLISPSFISKDYVTFQFDFGQDGNNTYPGLDNISIGLILTSNITNISNNSVSDKLTRYLTGGPSTLTSLNSFFITFPSTSGSNYSIYIKCESTNSYNIYMDNFNITQSTTLPQYTSDSLSTNTIYRITSATISNIDTLQLNTLSSKTVSTITALSSIDITNTITSGYYIYNNKLYINGILSTGYSVYDSILYINGVKTTGYYNGELYYNNLWTSRISDNNFWNSVTYGKDSSGNGLFVAVGFSSVMTSSDGINWTSRTAAANNFWNCVTYGNGLFVAVASTMNDIYINTTTLRVMTSPDGITWTGRTTPSDGADFRCITYGNSLFVAASRYNVITSPDGITWTSRTSISQKWGGVTYGNSVYVAVTQGTVSYVMTSSNGTTWVNRSVSTLSIGNSVTFGNGLFVAVSYNNGAIVTSTNGITWTTRTAPGSTWNTVTYGNGLFVAVASNTGAIATSPDGITWTSKTSPVNDWTSVTYGNGLFVAVASTGNYRVMTFKYSIDYTGSNMSIPVIINSIEANSITYTGITPNNDTTPQNVGSYTVKNNGTSITTYTINKATPPISVIIGIYVYNGLSQGPSSISGNTGNGTVIYSYYRDNTLLSSAPSDIGSYFVVASVTETTNYLSATSTESFSITASKATPSIKTLSLPSKTYGDSPFSLTDPISNSLGTFTYTSNNSSVADVSGNVVTIFGAGSSTITATQGESGNYSSGSVSTTLIVDKLPSLIPFSLIPCGLWF